jgi:hypothetical protein
MSALFNDKSRGNSRNHITKKNNNNYTNAKLNRVSYRTKLHKQTLGEVDLTSGNCNFSFSKGVAAILPEQSSTRSGSKNSIIIDKSVEPHKFYMLKVVTILREEKPMQLKTIKKNRSSGLLSRISSKISSRKSVINSESIIEQEEEDYYKKQLAEYTKNLIINVFNKHAAENEIAIYILMRFLVEEYITPCVIMGFYSNKCETTNSHVYTLLNETGSSVNLSLHDDNPVMSLQVFLERFGGELTVDILLNILFQILYTLKCFNLINLKHNDLHANNILIFLRDNNVFRSTAPFFTPNMIYEYRYGLDKDDVLHLISLGIDVRIFDFDLSVKNKFNLKPFKPVSRNNNSSSSTNSAFNNSASTTNSASNNSASNNSASNNSASSRKVNKNEKFMRKLSKIAEQLNQIESKSNILLTFPLDADLMHILLDMHRIDVFNIALENTYYNNSPNEYLDTVEIIMQIYAIINSIEQLKLDKSRLDDLLAILKLFVLPPDLKSHPDLFQPDMYVDNIMNGIIKYSDTNTILLFDKSSKRIKNFDNDESLKTKRENIKKKIIELITAKGDKDEIMSLYENLVGLYKLHDMSEYVLSTDNYLRKIVELLKASRLYKSFVPVGMTVIDKFSLKPLLDNIQTVSSL